MCFLNRAHFNLYQDPEQGQLQEHMGTETDAQ